METHVSFTIGQPSKTSIFFIFFTKHFSGLFCILIVELTFILVSKVWGQSTGSNFFNIINKCYYNVK